MKEKGKKNKDRKTHYVLFKICILSVNRMDIKKKNNSMD